MVSNPSTSPFLTSTTRSSTTSSMLSPATAAERSLRPLNTNWLFRSPPWDLGAALVHLPRTQRWLILTWWQLMAVMAVSLITTSRS